MELNGEFILFLFHHKCHAWGTGPNQCHPQWIISLHLNCSFFVLKSNWIIVRFRCYCLSSLSPLGCRQTAECDKWKSQLTVRATCFTINFKRCSEIASVVEYVIRSIVFALCSIYYFRAFKQTKFEKKTNSMEFSLVEHTKLTVHLLQLRET